jgi:hypothetical protein
VEIHGAESPNSLLLQAAIVKNEIKDRPILSFELLANGLDTSLKYAFSLVYHQHIAVQRKHRRPN